ncbi:TAXI family TRAP transporter solute-binding subunit [Acuticoccus mangrovi]|uniref:TAXI family TRAP transporter solute-binding subunit n=1 Tax=Acuticoccus mangrovi TaxID=2796142 RepID=A0A934MI36_9HYPH|nr:TAXI family TRAP transporter solute-binding subunit [Acuticoccus mangrovi]MBJ3777535.1 TAXI family TRAP transporter solute-binding subunit [Acuticoccus mangrovi]
MALPRLSRSFSLRSRIAALAAVAMVATPLAAQAEDPEFLTIGGGPSGGTFNVVATGLGDVLRKEFPDTLIDVQPGGSGPNLLRVSSGKADLGITSANNAFDAWNGRDPATPEHPIKNVRGLMTFFPSAIQIWVDANSDIETLEDLKGKQMSAGQPGQTSWLAFENLLSVYGMSIEDIESDGGQLHKLSWAESQNGLRNGQLDAVMWVSLYPHTTVLENETARPMRALSFDEDKLDEYLEKFGGGFEKVTLPAGLYGGQAEPALTVGTKTFLFANEDMPEETAYRIVETIWDNLDRFQKTHALLKFMDKDTVGKGMVVPLHPGAKKFFDEKGIPYSESKLQ